MKTNFRRLAVIALTVFGTLAAAAVSVRMDGVEGDRLEREEVATISRVAALIASAALGIDYFLRRLWA